MSGEIRFGKYGEHRTRERTMRSWLETLEALDEIPVGTPAWYEKYEEWDRAFHAWARAAIKTGYPNPERKGCPLVEVIMAMADHTLDPGDPAHGHAVRCSPCFNELWEIQGESETDAPAATGSRRTTGSRTTLSRDARETIRKEAHRLRLALGRIRSSTVAVFHAAADDADFALLDFACILDEAEALIRRQSEAFLREG